MDVQSKMSLILPLSFVILISVCQSVPIGDSYEKPIQCISRELKEEIASYETIVIAIKDYMSGPFKGKTYKDVDVNYNMNVFILLLVTFSVATAHVLPKDSDECQNILGDELVQEIWSYESVKDEILQYVLNGDFKDKTYDELAKFVDKFGARPSGSEVLEQSIDYMIELTREEDIHDIKTEELEVPHWVRGEEKITMLEPRKKNIDLLGLGRSISTPLDGVTGEVVVFKSFSELASMADEDVAGKIVLYDPIFTTYSETNQYRTQGAARAGAKGAIASLVRSIAPFSINTPHTGSQTYSDDAYQIPTAAITLEDADLIRRMYDRGEKVVLNIHMTSSFDTKISRNTLIDFKGSEKPEQLVIVSGHIDSWDVGQGAMDDGGGLFISWAVPVVLKRLNLKPRRSIRTIFWTAEELGLVGARAYEEAHRNESHNINFIMESDEGTFAPLGLEVGGTKEACCIIKEILKLFKSINASTLIEGDSPGSDISIFTGNGIPGASLYNANDKYFWFHHTEGDTMNVESPEELDLGTAFWTAASFIIADISIDIPRA